MADPTDKASTTGDFRQRSRMLFSRHEERRLKAVNKKTP
jgi:hypothetical protein